MTQERTSHGPSGRPHASTVQERCAIEYQTSKPLSDSARQDLQMREYFARVASSKDASLAFLKAAGILDANGSLAEPFKG